jgi:serine/threonine-protein kinase
MGEQKPKLFGEIALEQGLLTQAQVDECVAIQKQLRANGIVKTLGAICHDKGYLNLVEVNRIMEEVDGARRRHSIEGYEIISKLGKGGMGAVYLARQLSLGKLVALKILPPKLAQNADYLKRFRREAIATAKLNHPNIVAAYDVGESNGYNYFVMEYVEGETVKDLLERTGIVVEARALEIVTQVADALAHAWQQGIVHRDIKPANIMLTKHGQAKLCDLGLAIDRAEDSAITRSGVIMGTPYYLSPEQARSDSLDIRSDIYSLGATLFHMVTGGVPYEGETPAVILTKHLSEPVPDPLARNPILSKGICYIIRKMMEKEREARYQTPEDLLQDLHELRERSFLRGKHYVPDAPRTSATPARFAPSPAWRMARLLAFALPLSALLTAVAFDPALPAHTAERVRALWRRKDALFSTLPRLDDPLLTAQEAQRQAEQAAERLLDEAERLSALRPDDLEGARDRFASIARDYPTTGAGARARARLASVQNRIDREAKSLFFALAVEARAHRDAGRYADALRTLDRFPARFSETTWGVQAQKERELIEEAARGRWAEIAARATALAAGGEYAAARREVEAALCFGLEDVAKAAEAAAADFAAKAREAGAAAEEAARAERERLFGRAFAAIEPAAREGRLDEAAGAARAAATDPALAAVAEEVGRLRDDVESLAAAARAARERLAAAAGTEVRVRIAGIERAGVVDGVREGKLYLKIGPAVIAYALGDLDVAEWLSPEATGGKAEAARLQGLWQLFRGRDADARVAFDEAAREGADVALYRQRLAGKVD